MEAFVFFQLRYVLRDIGLNEGEAVEILEDRPHPTTLSVRRPLRGQEAGVTGTDCIGIVQTEEPVTEKVRAQFDVSDDPQPAVVDIGNKVGSRLHDSLLRVVCVLRWRTGTGCHNPVRHTRGLHWSDNAQTWKLVPGDLKLHIDVGIPASKMSGALRASFMGLIESGSREPLAQALFHEAWSQRTDSPRSSLLIGVAAAEVGFKSLVSALVPIAEWLAFHAPTPPLTKMLKEYLPLLPVKQTFGTSPFIPKVLVDALKKGIQLRNETAHKGGEVARETVKEVLIAILDLLYLLDFYSGHLWAIDNISHDTRVLIDSEVQRQRA